ncbi:hypothetical protein D9619_001657 [Psilocybe cf. subviscida]|uniref:Peroxidase n=1 Tax=Psilocybe cf. subviscida TaxID=2480587 RepID=A0A8H5BF08_9AGAR|nr:hypothetical protein D9619_001657 [Psilocybe cf. subviscida]
MPPTRKWSNALLAAAVTTSSLARLTAAAYVWPDPQYETLEGMFYEGTSFHGNQFAAFVANCAQRDDRNTTVAAEWVRLAYHDMATFNITDGTGGVDASIYYELDREENIGDGMIRTMGELSLTSNKYISRADVIAMAATWSVAACKGPILPFRGGRQDVFVAGRKGVPEPQQELKEHVESFRLQGFNATEMIALIACGHTLGGVREEDFPTIVPTNNQPSNRRLDTFDSTPQFDSAIAIEYIAGTTRNPLVVNSNQTILSDLRIFSSDKNVTMNRQVSGLKDPNTFSQTCSTLLTRMIDTVRKGVTLTEPIVPIPFKLSQQRFMFIGGELAFSTQFRILNTLNDQTGSRKRTVRLFWCDRRGANANCADGTANVAVTVAGNGLPSFGASIDGGVTAPTFAVGSPVSQALNMTMTFYTVTVSVAFERSVGKFWFSITEEGSPNSTVQDNDGTGYVAVDDEIVYLPVGFKGGPTIQVGPLTTDPDKSPFPIYIAAGIHSSMKVDSASIRAFDSTFSVRTLSAKQLAPPKALFNETFPLSENTSLPSFVGYNFYSAEVTNGLGFSQITADFKANVTDVSTGNKKTVGLDFVLAIDPQSVGTTLPPPLATISTVNLTSARNGTKLGSDAMISALPLREGTVYALLGLLGGLIYAV